MDKNLQKSKNNVFIKNDNKVLIELNIADLKKTVIVLNALCNDFRQHILEYLLQNNKYSVTDLYTQLNVPQAVISQQLSVLRKAGFVQYETEKKRVYYYINKKRFLDLENNIKTIFDVIKTTQSIESTNTNLINYTNVKQLKLFYGYLANQRRLNIIKHIDENRITTISKIVAELNLIQSETSIHLSKLKKANFVTAHSVGNTRQQSLSYNTLKQFAELSKKINTIN